MNENATTRVAAVAMNSVMGDPRANLDRVEMWAKRAREAGATFAVFPEECITGSMNKSELTFEQASAIASEAQRLTRPRLETLCKQLDMTLVVGTIEPGSPGSGKLRNSALVFGPTGFLASFGKLHIPNANETKWFEPGDRVVVVRSQGWMFSVGICYDLNFPEIFRAAAVAGADFFLLAVGCSGTADQAPIQRDAYTKLIHAWSVANGMYVFYANQVGKSGPAELCGLAFSVDPKGQLIDCLMAREGILVSEVSRAKILNARKDGDPANVWKVRPEAYANPLIVRA